MMVVSAIISIDRMGSATSSAITREYARNQRITARQRSAAMIKTTIVMAS
jgi:hypothetical protein